MYLGPVVGGGGASRSEGGGGEACWGQWMVPEALKERVNVWALSDKVSNLTYADVC